MKPASPRILTINGGSSSIKFAMFEAGDSLRRILEGGMERIGRPEATLRVKGLSQADSFSRLMTATDHMGIPGHPTCFGLELSMVSPDIQIQNVLDIQIQNVLSHSPGVSHAR